MAWRAILARLRGSRLWNPDGGEGPEQSERRIQAATALLFLVFSTVATPLFLLGYGGGPVGFWISLLAVAGYGLAYGLTMRGQQGPGAFLLLLTVFASVWVSVLRLVGGPAHEPLLVLTLIPLGMAAALGRNRVLWILAAANVGILVGLMAARMTAALAYSLGVFTSLAIAILLSVGGSLRDQERRRAQQAESGLERRMADQKALLDNLDEMVWIMDRDGTVLARNDKAANSFEGAFGYAFQEGDNWFEVVPDERQEQARASFERVLAGESFHLQRTFNIHGQPRDLDVSYRPVRDDAGEAIGVSVSARDVTEEKETQRLREATIRQEAEIGQLREREALRKELLSTASHELATPLTPIKLQLAVFRRRHADEMTEEQLRSLEVLERSTDRLATLATDILDVARLESRRMRFRFGPFDLCQVLRNEARLMEPYAKGGSITIEQDCPATPVEVVADEGRIGQVVANLLSNAVKFSREGGHVRLACQATEDDVTLTVEDEGQGIPPEGLERLFQPFSQVHDPDLAVGGTGLGLFICKGIVEGHGGTIEADSEGPGQGATFTVRLPRRAAGAPDDGRG